MVRWPLTIRQFFCKCRLFLKLDVGGSFNPHHFNVGFQNEIVCKEVEARLCGDQSSVELVIDECSEEVKTSCQIGIEMGPRPVFKKV